MCMLGDFTNLNIVLLVWKKVTDLHPEDNTLEYLSYTTLDNQPYLYGGTNGLCFPNLGI